MAQAVHDVAAAVITLCNPIDPLKLQKLVFFAAAEYAALTDEPMFPEPVEAWDYGPVVYDLWKTYRDYEGRADITEPERGDVNRLNDLEMGCVESAVQQFGHLTSAYLIEVSHREPAWKFHYVAGQHRTPIPHEALRETFRAKASEKYQIDPELLGFVFA